MTNLWAILMAGGTGTRFWPASREARPKQLLPIGGEQPLLQRTSQRLGDLVPPARQLVVTSSRYVGAVAELLPDVPPSQILGEPVGRDTAPCIGMAARIVAHMDEDAIVVALPSDHVLGDDEAFRASLRSAVAALQEHDKALLVFGVKPDHPSEAYGYLAQGERVGTFLGRPVHRLERFVEKPSRKAAEKMLAAGGCLWNAGLFVFRPAALAAAFERHLPELGPRLEHIAKAWDIDGRGSADHFEQALGEEFPMLPPVSLDKGVMEKLDLAGGQVLLLPLDVSWDDVGSWSALARLHKADKQGNVTEGQAVVLDGKDNIVAAPGGGLVAVKGVDGLIVVHTPDATLVCRRDDDQGVRAIVDELKKRGLDAWL